VPAELFTRGSAAGDAAGADAGGVAGAAAHADRSWVIIPPRRAGWDQLALGEWELRAAGFGDCHPHDEVNYVLTGTLEVDCGGQRVVARAGDVVRVPANEPAYYYAPEYAHMIYIYGPNPTGEPAWTFTDRERVSPPAE